MSYVKERSCAVCGKSFVWKIARPGDGFWDRWRNDDGDTLASWFITNTLCQTHALEKMPDKFRRILLTEYYEES